MGVINYIKKFLLSSKYEFQAYRDIWFPLFLYQIIARSGITIAIIVGYPLFIEWISVSKDQRNIFLNGLQTLELIHIDRLIVTALIFIVFFIFTSLFEVLGILSISRQYYSGKKVTFTKTFAEVMKLFIQFSKALILKYTILFSLIILIVLLVFIILILLQNIFGIIIATAIAVYALILLFQKIINLNDISQRSFEYYNSISQIYSENISNKRMFEIQQFYILKIFLIGAFIFLFPIIQLGIIWGVTRFADVSILVSSILLGIVILLGFTIGILFSFIVISFFALRGSRMYLEDTSGKNSKHLKYSEKKYLRFKKSLLIVSIFAYFLLFLILSGNIYKLFYTQDQKLPLVFGHRGSIGIYPENSIPAIKYSIDQGADYIEVDVQLSKDGIPVIFHDLTYNDGLKEKYISNTSMQELKDFNLSPNQRNFIPIPSLEDILIFSKGKIKVNMELKSIPNFEEELAKKVALIVTKLSMEKSVIISSFHYEVLQEVKKINPNISTGLVVAAYFGDIQNFNNYSVDWIMVYETFYAFYRKDFLSLNKKIILWSYSPRFNGRKSFQDSLDGAIVDDPKKLKTIINNYKNSSLDDQFFIRIKNVFLSQ